MNSNPTIPSLPIQAAASGPAAPAPAPGAAPGAAQGAAPDVAPGRARTEPPAAARTPSLLGRLGRDSAYVLAALPIAIASFAVLVTGLSLAAGLLITVIGIPVAVATLAVASGFASLERSRLVLRGTPLTPVRRRAKVTGRSWLRRMLTLLADRSRWAEVLHGILVLPIAIATWSIVLTWWAGTLGGLTYWFWTRWLPDSAPDSNTTLPELLNLPISDSLFNLLVGLAFAATLVPVVRGCANLQAAWADLLLSGSSRRALEERVEDLTERRVAAASAEAQALRQFERDLHDGPQQRLVRLGMDLSVAERRLDDDPAAARELLGLARMQASEALAELRALSRGIAPPILSDRGLEAALAAVTARTPFATRLDVDLGAGPRPPAAVENAAYYVVSEALTNTTKHAGASSAAVSLRRVRGADSAEVLRVVIDDDGTGGADIAKGHGLAGLSDRVAGLDGTLSIDSPLGGPTRLVAELPC
ncbi:sensor histidine kinase [Pengzhenrongella sicca]|uniref:histidine kinase n=1 Tax=Pengzhenrongella sicca TaxID=2819238 RepID=A0A8A4Z9W7_9MICO|nr:sensor histidine kinase [Pengzhenrongella sicca]QTE28702.1 sensor domain-containing protein [Pengzhenrongella sicca]